MCQSGLYVANSAWQGNCMELGLAWHRATTGNSCVGRGPLKQGSIVVAHARSMLDRGEDNIAVQTHYVLSRKQKTIEANH